MKGKDFDAVRNRSLQGITTLRRSVDKKRPLYLHNDHFTVNTVMGMQ